MMNKIMLPQLLIDKLPKYKMDIDKFEYEFIPAIDIGKPEPLLSISKDGDDVIISGKLGFYKLGKFRYVKDVSEISISLRSIAALIQTPGKKETNILLTTAEDANIAILMYEYPTEVWYNLFEEFSYVMMSIKAAIVTDEQDVININDYCTSIINKAAIVEVKSWGRRSLITLECNHYIKHLITPLGKADVMTLINMRK